MSSQNPNSNKLPLSKLFKRRSRGPASKREVRRPMVQNSAKKTNVTPVKPYKIPTRPQSPVTPQAPGGFQFLTRFEGERSPPPSPRKTPSQPQPKKQGGVTRLPSRIRKHIKGSIYSLVKKVKSPASFKMDTISGSSSKASAQMEPKSYETLFLVDRLKKDGRKSPMEYKQNILAASSPSQLSVRTLTEHYELPVNQLESPEDVFNYRGYKKLAKIDEGAFGVVSKAIRLADRSTVAVKEVDLRKKKAKRIEEMKRELFVLQKVDSPLIVELIEHFIIGQTLVIIMEFCAGGNLTGYLKEFSINEDEARHFFKQMAMSIKVLHRKSIAHRDIKLNNFLLDSTRRLVKVADFGLSVVSFKPADGFLMAKTYCGTEPYMAPELLRRNRIGFRHYNPIYADIWSLGICLYAMLTRTFPFKMHTSQQGLLQAQVTRKWRFPRRLRGSVSEELKDLVWHMLDPDAERRITINSVLSHPWCSNNQLFALSHDESVDFNNNSPGPPPGEVK